MSISFVLFFIILFSILSIFFFYYYSSSTYLLIITELFWIALYMCSLFLAYYLNNFNILALSLFFLIFSATEVSIALVLISLQKLVKTNFNILSTNTNTKATLKSTFNSISIL